MAKTRTTERLVKLAVSAAEAAGLTVGAIEVAPGGAVRILALEAVAIIPSKKPVGDSCDQVFD